MIWWFRWEVIGDLFFEFSSGWCLELWWVLWVFWLIEEFWFLRFVFGIVCVICCWDFFWLVFGGWRYGLFVDGGFGCDWEDCWFFGGWGGEDCLVVRDCCDGSWVF